MRRENRNTIVHGKDNNYTGRNISIFYDVIRFLHEKKHTTTRRMKQRVEKKEYCPWPGENLHGKEQREYCPRQR